MKKLLNGLAMAALLFAGAASGANAQEATAAPDFGLGTVTAVCHDVSAAADACRTAMQAYIERVKAAGLEPDVVDDLIADLVVALSTDLPPELRAVVAEVITEAAAEMNDPERADLVVAIAEDIRLGNEVDIAAIEEASPA